MAKPLEVPLLAKVKIVKIPKYNRSNTFTRILSWITGFIRIVFLLKTRYSQYEVFASTNPPFLNLLPLFCKNKISLLVYDIFPDGLAAAGFINTNNLIYKRWSKWNTKAFSRLHTITTLTAGMSKQLSKYVNEERISIVSAWSSQNIEKLNTSSVSNELIRKYKLQDKFLVVYSGNLGKGYDIESIVHLAKNLEEYKNIQILIVGNGYQKETIKKIINSMQLTNCLLLPSQTTDLFNALLSAMRIGIVSLEYGTSEMAIPSKLYNLLAAGKPVVCLGSQESDLARLIEQRKVGRTFSSSMNLELKEFVLQLSSDPDYYNSLSGNAFLASKQFTYKNAEILVRNHII